PDVVGVQLIQNDECREQTSQLAGASIQESCVEEEISPTPPQLELPCLLQTSASAPKLLRPKMQLDGGGPGPEVVTPAGRFAHAPHQDESESD
ncbi:unnamed protein product, partial [Amoebophrya sp. A120]